MGSISKCEATSLSLFLSFFGVFSLDILFKIVLHSFHALFCSLFSFSKMYQIHLSHSTLCTLFLLS